MAILATIHDSVRAGLGWKEQMKRAIRDPHELARRLNLPEPTEGQIQAARQFGLFVPEAYLSRIQKGNPLDPLLVQVLPVEAENRVTEGYVTDPLDESGARKSDGLLQKYRGRVLLITSPVCAINCRYCFRRHFPYEQTPVSDQQWNAALDVINADDSIEEAIFSGGDPLTLVDEKLSEIVRQVDRLPHISRIRFHTRLPIVIPDRVTQTFINLLKELESQVYLVIHCNHANELDASVADALARLKQAGATLLNQSVLLRGVNDTVEDLLALSKRLMECDVLPYYLHQLDRVQGASHFEVPVEQGIQLVEAIRARLPGYAVPRYVREEPGQPNKTIIC